MQGVSGASVEQRIFLATQVRPGCARGREQLRTAVERPCLPAFVRVAGLGLTRRGSGSWLLGGCFFGAERAGGGRSRAGSSGRGSACVGSAQGPEAPTVSDSERRHAAVRPPGGQRPKPKARSYSSHDRSEKAEIEDASGPVHAIAVRCSRRPARAALVALDSPHAADDSRHSACGVRYIAVQY